MLSWVPDFTAPEYQHLHKTANNKTLNTLLLWHVSRVCGPFKKPKLSKTIDQNFYIIETRPITADQQRRIHTIQTLVLLQSRFGNGVVHFQQTLQVFGTLSMAEYRRLVFPTNISRFQMLFAMAQYAPVPAIIPLIFRFNLLSYHHSPCVYKPEHRIPDGDIIPLNICPHNFITRLNSLAHGALSNFPWDLSDVIVAGGAAAACLVPPKTDSNAYQDLDIDIFVFSFQSLHSILQFFNTSFPNDVLFGVNGNIICICIKNIPRTFQIIPFIAMSVRKLLVNFDLDFCQVGFTQKTVYLTPNCLRAHATRICHVHPGILPFRQLKALKKGFGLQFPHNQMEALQLVTPWEMGFTYRPHPSHSLPTIYDMMYLYLKCSYISPFVLDTLHQLQKHFELEDDSYMPIYSTLTNYTGPLAFLPFDPSKNVLLNTLQPYIPPLLGSIVLRLPHRYVFPRRPWLVCNNHTTLILKSTYSNYIAEGYHEIVTFLNHIQQIMDEKYGVTHAFKFFSDSIVFLNFSILTKGRIYSTLQRTNVHTLTNKQNTCLCMALCCSSIILYDTFWIPKFYVNSAEILPIQHVQPGF